MHLQKPIVLQGEPHPLGCSTSSLGTNIAFFSTSSSATILLFLSNDDPPISIPLESSQHQTDSIWHLFLYQIFPPFAYAIQIHDRILLDPYAKGFLSDRLFGKEDRLPLISQHFIPPPFDWEGTQKPSTPFHEWIIYEAHIRGFTNSPSSKSKNPGSFLGFIEKIPHLSSLGVNAVELLPIFSFNECEIQSCDPISKKPLYNFWGYSTQNFFTPMPKYAVGKNWGDAIIECKTLIRELHRHNIAVILDVVYNHTGEGDTTGPLFSFKGLAPNAYYLLNPMGGFSNFSGTGNTMNCNHPMTMQLIVDSLAFWAEEMQIDAFRFDLASIFCRDKMGIPIDNPPILEKIKQCPALQHTPLIAEAWDAAGLYQVGSFPGKDRWSEWNGWYRDTIRRFIKGTPGQAGNFAKALCGSQDLYWKDSPARSINFVTCHDGFTLRDLVSYEKKHNTANGEENRDGTSNNESWNCGVEGETSDKWILSLRKRQQKNFFLALMVSLGVPMFLMGDEVGHTKQGNNNSYCQDNELNWLSWEFSQEQEDLLEFFKKAIAFRKKKKHLFCRDSFLSTADVEWHGRHPLQPDWSSSSHLVVYTLKDPLHSDCLLAFNASPQRITIHLPPINKEKQHWYRIADTSIDSPQDFVSSPKRSTKQTNFYTINPFSSILLELH